MQDLITIGAPNADRSRTVDANVVRINRFEDLRAGQYWRAKDDVPALLKPEQRERDVFLPKDHPDYRKEGYRSNVIGSEKYMVEVPVRSALPAGRMHLVQSLKLVDGDIHAVVLKGHPSEPERSDRTYLVDEFLHCFEQVDEAEAQRIRQEEIAALHAEISDLQNAMIAGPPQEAPTALLGHQEKLPPKPSVGTMIANIGHIQKLQETAERAVAMAQRQSTWIQTHTKEIGEKTAALVPFFQERASAALAATESVMRYAGDLQKGVQSLNLYTGKDVEVKRLSEGASAPAEEPLRIYRDMLFLDEEYLVHLDQEGRSGGADANDFDDFVEALTTDAKLMARVLPYPRMIVLMRYRNSDKAYFGGTSIEAAFANAAYNEPNHMQFLLVRDGDNLFQVWSELTTQAIGSLYPNKAMGDAPFRGVDGGTIGIDDLNLADSKGRFDDLNRVYKNLLILLWGLNDREGMFGPFYDPADWTPSGFIDEGFQAKYFRFWDPYGDRNAIGTGRPYFTEWVRGMNKWLRSGSRVLVMRRALAGDEALGKHNTMEKEQPGAVRAIGDAALEFVVRRTKKGHVVPVDAGRMVYPQERYRDAYRLKQTFDVPLSEEADGYSVHGTLLWLCLDMIEASDIDHYLESRLDRRSYMQFYKLLLAARDQLREEDVELAPVIAKLEAAFGEAPAELPAGTSARDLARQAIRLWRTANRGAMVPAAGTSAHAGVYKTLLGNMWTLAGNDHPVAEAETLCAAQGRTPLRLVMTGKDRFAVYATSVGDEIEDRLFEHVWVTRLACQRKGGALKATSTKVVVMPDSVADEEVLHEWDALAQWKGVDVPTALTRPLQYDREREPLTYDVIRKAFAIVQSSSLEAFRTPPPSLDLALRQLNEKRHAITKGSSVPDLHYVQPFAIIRRTTFERKLVPGFSARYESFPVTQDYKVLSLQDDAYRMLHRLCATDEERKQVVVAFASHYERKVVQMGNFQRDVDKHPTIGVTTLASWAKAPRDPLGRDSSWRGMALDANWSENFRQFDVQRIENHAPGRDPLWSPKLDEMTVWMDPTAPAILNDLCATHGWDAVPFVPDTRWW